jgi:hypothetical protein
LLNVAEAGQCFWTSAVRAVFRCLEVFGVLLGVHRDLGGDGIGTFGGDQ